MIPNNGRNGPAHYLGCKNPVVNSGIKYLIDWLARLLPPIVQESST